MKSRNTFYIAIAVLIGAALGAFGMHMLSSMVYGYGYTARFIADASTDLAALEKLASNQPDEVEAILKMRLQGSMTALDADKNNLTATQLDTVRSLEDRARVFLEGK
jgi:hypothetical protein